MNLNTQIIDHLLPNFELQSIVNQEYVKASDFVSKALDVSQNGQDTHKKIG